MKITSYIVGCRKHSIRFGNNWWTRQRISINKQKHPHNDAESLAEIRWLFRGFQVNKQIWWALICGGRADDLILVSDTRRLERLAFRLWFLSKWFQLARSRSATESITSFESIQLIWNEKCAHEAHAACLFGPHGGRCARLGLVLNCNSKAKKEVENGPIGRCLCFVLYSILLNSRPVPTMSPPFNHPYWALLCVFQHFF